MGVLTIILIAIFFLFTSQSTAEIQSLNIRSNDENLTFIEEFKFTNTGYVSVAVSSVSVSSPYNFNPSCIAFILVKSEFKHLAFRLLDRNFGPNINSSLISPIFSFQNLSSTPYSPFNITRLAPYPGVLSLYFANCNLETYVTMDVRTEIYNTINNGTTKVYLSLMQLPSFYFKLSLVYLCFLVFWILFCFKNKEYVHRIELLMGGLLVMSVLLLICEAVEKHFVKISGTPHGWDTIVYIFQFLRFVLLITMIVLNCTAGWSRSDIQVELVKLSSGTLLILTGWSYVPSIVIGDDVPFEKLVDIFFEVVGIFAILVPIFVSITSLQFASKKNKMASTRLKKVKGFLVVASGYLFYWRIPIWVVKVYLGYKYYRWVSIVGDEICNLLFYMIMMFYLFSRVRKMMNTSILMTQMKRQTDSFVGL